MPERRRGRGSDTGLSDTGLSGDAGLVGAPACGAVVSSRPPAGRAEAGPGADADPQTIARLICLRMLTAAPRTQAQLRAALRRRGVPEDAAAAVLARFAEVKLIDDVMFARAWVDSRHYGRGLASRALAAELRQRGVADRDVQAALSELEPGQELATARELVARRLQATAGMPTPARMRRLVGLLARKGYPPGLAYRVVREALELEAEDGHVPGIDLAEMPEPDDADEAVEL